jgi:23S rRNA pseudouridine1911/1915/1917 synthase
VPTGPLRVLYEDNHLLLVDKPAGLLSQGGPRGETSLVEAVERHRRETEGKPGRAFVGLVHRLDRNVSGVVAVAKTSKAARRLSEAFRDRAPGLEKTYLAWVAGVVPEDARLASRLVRRSGVTHEDEETAGGREARLSFKVGGRGRNASRLEVALETGVTHQIRAQLAARGWPLLGDVKYGGPRGPRPALHSWRLKVPHPVGGRPVEAVAPVPQDLRALDRRLGIVPPLGP